MTLVSAAQIAALRSVANRGLQTDVTIFPRIEADNPFSDDENVTTSGGTVTVKGWLRTVPAGVIDVVSGVQAQISSFRLLLPPGTVIHNGDRVEINSEKYVVEDVASENTYQIFLVCSIRRAE